MTMALYNFTYLLTYRISQYIFVTVLFLASIMTQDVDVQACIAAGYGVQLSCRGLCYTQSCEALRASTNDRQ